MARPTVASLEAQILVLKDQISSVEEYLQEIDPDDRHVDPGEIVEAVAEILNIDVSKYRDVVWNITVRGRVKVDKYVDPDSLDLTVRNQTVSCRDMGVYNYETVDMEVNVDEVWYA